MKRTGGAGGDIHTRLQGVAGARPGSERGHKAEAVSCSY